MYICVTSFGGRCCFHAGEHKFGLTCRCYAGDLFLMGFLKSTDKKNPLYIALLLRSSEPVVKYVLSVFAFELNMDEQIIELPMEVDSTLNYFALVLMQKRDLNILCEVITSII